VTSLPDSGTQTPTYFVGIYSFQASCVTLAIFSIPQTKTVFTITAGNKTTFLFEISHPIISTPSPVDRNFETSKGTRVG
jgi:hypothetical protein